jgi:hypothetical protein
VKVEILMLGGEGIVQDFSRIFRIPGFPYAGGRRNCPRFFKDF